MKIVEKHNFIEKDICLLIATYHRPDDIERTLKTLIEQNNIPGGIIIIDQSKDNATRKICSKYKKILPLKYLHIDIPSADISMNLGIKEAMKNFPLLLTSGDDVDYLHGYLKALVKEFNEHPLVVGVAGIEQPVDHDLNLLKNKLQNLLLRMFFLPYQADHQFKVTGPYGHTSSPRTIRPIRDAQWLPGSSTCFKREVYEKRLWPEIVGYNVIDDILFSHNVFREYRIGSLVIHPDCKTIHRKSMVGRYPDRKRIFVNHEDHMYFYYQSFYTSLGTIKLLVSLIGIIFGNMLGVLIKPSREWVHRLRYNLEAIKYCYSRRNEIKKGILRQFLDKDLGMKI